MVRPAWSASFSQSALREVANTLPRGRITPRWAWGGATGRGVRVGILDTGIDNSHPAVGGAVRGWAAFSEVNGRVEPNLSEHSDALGHGTACAGIIHAAAPEAELHSIKVMGSIGGKASEFVAGLRWAIEQRFDVMNLSLGTTRREAAEVFYELTDKAYFEGLIIVTAANNRPLVSYPSLYSSVVSVASHEGTDPFHFYYNPEPPVEFGAPGMNVRVAWSGGQTIVATGNSFAAPHIAGIIALMRSKHPGLTPFEIKTILRATATNARHGPS